jgi:4-hydroxy-3-polyprenylbenzoate decarboxylase
MPAGKILDELPRNTSGTRTARRRPFERIAPQGIGLHLQAVVSHIAVDHGKELILVPRETPLSLIHLRNLTRVTEAGAVVIPAAPGFYHRPTKIAELVDFIVQRVLDQLGLSIEIGKRWGQG